MSAAAQPGRQRLVTAWLVQMIGTLVLAGVVLAYVRSAGAPFGGGGDSDWKRYAMMGILVGIAPALLYLRTFKARLNAYEATMRDGALGDPALHAVLLRSLSIGGALCELPMAMGVVQLFFGGETRWFLGATMMTIALRLSYRPFIRA